MENWNLLGMSVFEMYFYFWFWSIFGWILEVVDRTLETGGFENRGFMNGPYCPIYGVGVIGIYTLLSPIENPMLVFILSSLMCTVFELAVGLLLQALFHAKWWDYSDMKFNFMGYVCLRNSLFWGVACLIVIKIAQPAVAAGVSHIPFAVGNIAAVFMTILFIYDLVESICEVRNLNNKLREIDALAKIIHDKSILIGEKISDEVLNQKAKYDKISGDVQAQYDKLSEGVQAKYERISDGVQAKYEKLTDEVAMTRLKYEMLIEQTKKQSRLIRAFPTMKSTRYNNALKAIKDKIYQKSDKDK